MQKTPRSYQQLQPEDRVTMASLLQQNHSLRAIAKALNRSPSTVSREQNAALVEESAAAAASLKQQAQTLVQAVSVFKLRDDTSMAGGGSGRLRLGHHA